MQTTEPSNNADIIPAKKTLEAKKSGDDRMIPKNRKTMMKLESCAAPLTVSAPRDIKVASEHKNRPITGVSASVFRASLHR